MVLALGCSMCIGEILGLTWIVWTIWMKKYRRGYGARSDQRGAEVLSKRESGRFEPMWPFQGDLHIPGMKENLFHNFSGTEIL